MRKLMLSTVAMLSIGGRHRLNRMRLRMAP